MTPARTEAIAWLLVAIPGAMLLGGLWSGAYDASPWRFAVRESGLWAMRLTVAALAVSPFVALTGWRWIEPSRQALGLGAALYAFAHVWYWMRQYAFDWLFLLEELVRLFLLLGLAATLLMIPLAATSNGFARRRLGMAVWRRLHLLVYPAAVAGWWHYALAVRLDRTELYAQGLVVVAALAHRGWRAAVPARG
jgi:methionine sulfoxide reductase heme-binding subunit